MYYFIIKSLIIYPFFLLDCTFSCCEVNETGEQDVLVAGGAINVAILNGGALYIIDERINSSCTFTNCHATGSRGCGGAIALYFEDEPAAFVLSGCGFSFTSCSAAHGDHIFIDGANLSNIITPSSFGFKYDLSEENYLMGFDQHNALSFIPLRMFLCPFIIIEEMNEITKYDCRIGCYEFLDICYYLCPKDTIQSPVVIGLCECPKYSVPEGSMCILLYY